MTATRVDEFCPDFVWTDPETDDIWLYIRRQELTHKVYEAYPNICRYEGKRYYKMGFNTDTNRIGYREAGQRAYHERYSRPISLNGFGLELRGHRKG